MKPKADLWRFVRRHARITILSEGEDGMAILYKKLNGGKLQMIVGWGGGWDHVSVSRPGGKLPTYHDMKLVKRMFFAEDEWAVEYHPPEAEYVNNHPVLHIWRPQNETLPTPPKEYV